MSEGVSLIIWPTTAKYSLISLWFYVLCQKLEKYCNNISILKWAYLYNHLFKSYELNSVRNSRRSTLLSLYNAKWDFHTIKHHTTTNSKLPNIAILSEPTISLGWSNNVWALCDSESTCQCMSIYKIYHCSPFSVPHSQISILKFSSCFG